ncbi:Mitochondrial substrate carrier family protein S [Hondaea fermentalgiana]|uniref:Mitochondrial substrate carrier family protein S n=1 Tax=Hondaea fermentalgiana TaxID=2315210 RepID=A0A2R5GV08_9STRA|nr:Mitochondrial substrate carrier family protein S [Hondaea fermentalgiana]|eukprot:GBG32231.1 Mitochondrial substrate carrier family protein S [Hondaea fermentalgiana]
MGGAGGGTQTSGAQVLVCGSFAGACSVLASAPFDCVKVRMQTNSARFRTFSQALARTVREESAFSLYRGVSPALTSAIIENSVVFAANSAIRQQALALKASRNDTSPLSHAELSAIGGLSGVFSATAICAPETIKCRMQAASLSLVTPPGQPSAAPRFASSLDCFLQTLRMEGVSGLFRGLPAQIARDVPFNFVFFGAYEMITSLLCVARRVPDKSELTGPWIVLAGGMAGVAGWSLTLPFDVVKSTMQVSTQANPSTSRTVREIFVSKGLRGFFKGWTAAAVRAFPCNGALFLGYEFSNRALDRIRGHQGL